MMQTKTVAGALLTLDNGDKITHLNGRPIEGYIQAVGEVLGEALPIKSSLIWPIKVGVAPFLGLLTTGELSYGSPVTVWAQNELETVEEWKPETGPQIRITSGDLVFSHTDLSKGGGVFVAVIKDANEGQMVANLFTVAVANPPTLTGGNKFRGQPGTPTPVPDTPLTPTLISLTAQYRLEDGNQMIRGDAMIRIAADAISEQALIDCDSINITPINGPMQLFTLWDGSVSIIKEQTYFWTLYLKRLQQ